MIAKTKTFRFLLPLVLVAAALAGCAENGGGDDTPTPTGGGTGTPTPSPSPSPSPTGVVPTPTSIPSPPVSGPTDDYGITTGGSTGVYFQIGNGIQRAVRNTSTAGFVISEVATSQGSVQNIERLRANDYQIATVQNDVAFYAAKGEGSFSGNPVSELRALGSLYPEAVQIIVLKESNINTLQDLANKRVVLGAPGSGAAVNAGQILNASGVQANTQYLDLSTAADRLKDGGVDAVFWTGGLPTGAIVSLGTTHPVRVVPIDGEARAALQAAAPFYANATVPAGTYGGVDQDVQTVAVMAILVANGDVAADDAASLLRIIYEGGDVQQSHAQGRNIKLENAFVGISGIPWHDGAKYYYATKGMTPPS